MCVSNVFSLIIPFGIKMDFTFVISWLGSPMRPSRTDRFYRHHCQCKYARYGFVRCLFIVSAVFSLAVSNFTVRFKISVGRIDSSLSVGRCDCGIFTTVDSSLMVVGYLPLKISVLDCASGPKSSQRSLCPLGSCGRVAGILSAAISPVVAQAGPADPVPLRPALGDRDFALSRVFPPRL